MKLKPIFSTEQLLRCEVTPQMARSAAYSGTFKKNFGIKPIHPPADGQNKGPRK